MTEWERDAVALLRNLHRLDRAAPGDDGAAALELHATASIARLQSQPDAWETWLQRHELAGYCFALLRGAGLDGALAPAVAEGLARAYRRQVRRNERLLALLKAMKACLDEAGVPFLVMKGFLQSVRYAGGLNRRLMWDQDILIRPEHLGMVMTAAESLGLRARVGTGLDPSRLIRRLHAIELLDEKRKLDIHWVFRNRQGMRRTYDDVAETAQPLRLGDIGIHGIGDLDALTMACLGLANDIERSHVRLRKVWDVYLIVTHVEDEADWEGWIERLDREGARRTVLNVLSFCLLALDAGDDCPRLSVWLDRYAGDLLIGDRAVVDIIMGRPRQSLRNRMLMSRLQPVPAARYWAWWIGTLPIRYWHGRNV